MARRPMPSRAISRPTCRLPTSPTSARDITWCGRARLLPRISSRRGLLWGCEVASDLKDDISLMNAGGRIVIALLVLAGVPDTLLADTPAATPIIICFGDSITTG